MKFLNENGQQEVDAFLYHLCNLLAAVEESKHEQSVSDKLNKKLFNDNAFEFTTNLLAFVKAGGPYRIQLYAHSCIYEQG